LYELSNLTGHVRGYVRQSYRIGDIIRVPAHNLIFILTVSYRLL